MTTEKYAKEKDNGSLASAMAIAKNYLRTGLQTLNNSKQETIKKIILSGITAIATVLVAHGQVVNIPDSAFKAYLVGHPYINSNGDNEIQLSEAQAYTGGVIPGENDDIADLTGLEAFTAITHFGVGGNQLTNVDVSNNTELLVLHVSNTSLTNIDISNNLALTNLNLSTNQLTSVDVSNNLALTNLNLSRNQLTSVDLSNNQALNRLSCWDNQLTSLDLSNNTELTDLDCFNNQLTSLNVANGNNINFTRFFAINNPNLFCIQVDDSLYSVTNWESGIGDFGFDSIAQFSEDCSLLTSVTEINETRISVYPNPTLSQINFSTPSNVQLTDLTGQIVAQRKNTSTLDLSDLPSGAYILTITNYNGQILQRSKIMKE